MRAENWMLDDGREFCRISKAEARRLYEGGMRVFIAPINANIASPWMDGPYPMECGYSSFQSYVNMFEFYNCNAEMGRYSKFFVQTA